jgi:hypothetical protein
MTKPNKIIDLDDIVDVPLRDTSIFVDREYTYLKLIQKSKNQQHPFHVLASSRLPFFIALFAGSLAITLIIKLQNISDLNNFMFVGSLIMEPFFSVQGSLPSVEMPDSIIDSRLLQCLSLLLICI